MNPISLLAVLSTSLAWGQNAPWPLNYFSGKKAQPPAPVAGAPVGLFTLVSQGKRQLIELREDQLGKPFLFSARVEKGTGEKGVFSTIVGKTELVAFRKAGDKVQFVILNTGFRADPGTPEAKMVAQSYPDSPLVTLPIVSKDEAKKTLRVSAEALFLKDVLDIGRYLAWSYQSSPMPLNMVSPLSPVEDESSLEKIASFSGNLEAQAQLMFRRSNSYDSSTLPDARVVPVSVHYSIAELPKDPAEKREADPRVGYFETSYQDFSRADLKARESPLVHLVNKWHLEKKDPKLAVSEVKRPIVFWMEDTVPLDRRPLVRSGVLAWNEAFEAVGFKNALVVKEVDKDLSAAKRKSFDPADISYNMVRWFTGQGAGFSMGSWRANPQDGRVFNATIHMGDIFTRIQDWIAPLVPPRAKPVLSRDDGDHAERALQEASSALALLQARGISEQEKQKFMDELLTETVIHETGHILGLRHNFKASRMLDLDQVGKDGLISASVMDYLPANIAPAGKPQGPYFQTKIGPYDKWAIQYAYAPVSTETAKRRLELDAIAGRSAKDPFLAFATDEEADKADPDTQRFDLGKDPVAYARSSTQLSRELWKRLEARASSSQDYGRLRRDFMVGSLHYWNAVENALPVIGGVRSSRDKPSQGRSSYEPVSAQQQRLALRFFEEAVFDPKALEISPKLLKRLTADPLDEPGASPIAWGSFVAAAQKNALAQLHDGARLTRLAENATLDPKSRFGAAELIGEVRASVWKELSGTQPIHPLRRGLQRGHAEVLIGALRDPSVPGDARAAARQNLSVLDGQIAKRLSAGGLDQASRAHLQDVSVQIKAALKVKAE